MRHNHCSKRLVQWLQCLICIEWLPCCIKYGSIRFCAGLPPSAACKKRNFQHWGAADTAEILQYASCEAIFACPCAVKHAFASRRAAVLALKRHMNAPRDVDLRFRRVYMQLGMLNIRQNARRTPRDPSAAGARRAGAQRNWTWNIAWRVRGPAAGLWFCGKRPCSWLVER